MTGNAIAAKPIRTPLFLVLLTTVPAVYPLQLIFSDYLNSQYVAVPFRETAALYVLGVTSYIYGITSLYTYETDTVRKSALKCLVGVLGAVTLYVNLAWTAARWCFGIDGACG